MLFRSYSIFISDLEHQGYLPEAVTNWIALMGWSFDDHTEFFTMQDLVEKFSLERLNPSPAAINFSKLDHFNGLHIRNLANEDLARRLKPFFLDAGYPADDQRLRQIAPIVRERIVTLDDALPMAGFFFRDDVHPAPQSLVGKNMTAAQSAEAVRKAILVLEGLPEITHETAEQPLRNLALQLGLSAGQFFGILRSAITGQTVSPPLFESMAIIGKPTVIKRLSEANAQLSKMDAPG